MAIASGSPALWGAISQGSSMQGSSGWLPGQSKVAGKSQLQSATTWFLFLLPAWPPGLLPLHFPLP